MRRNPAAGLWLAPAAVVAAIGSVLVTHFVDVLRSLAVGLLLLSVVFSVATLLWRGSTLRARCVAWVVLLGGCAWLIGSATLARAFVSALSSD